MISPIPNFDHNLVLPPHLGDPRVPKDTSPYQCSSLELCQKFATSPARITILKNFLAFRDKLNHYGLLNGFQWLGGSFLEDAEKRESRSPNDLDLVTIYWDYDMPFQRNLEQEFPEFTDACLAKLQYKLDHYPFDASYCPMITVAYSAYWIQLFSHNRDAVWKGILQVPLNTVAVDADALQYLKNL
ncbi:MAG: hypothetical protein QM520_06750 [Gammaproteobacteria bacterium]|nr:hypothetical protein [Gammaproteobacteria bacterium]